MLRLSLPLRAFSSRRPGREAVFLPWNARPWPTYDTHAEEWKFLDRALSAVVEMTPQEVSDKSLRLCPRHLLHEIEDPVVVLQQRRRRRPEGQRTPNPRQRQQQQQQQQQRRRKKEEEPVVEAAAAERQGQKERPTNAGLRAACFRIDNSGASVGKAGCGYSTNAKNTALTTTAAVAAGGSGSSSSSSDSSGSISNNNNNIINRGRKRKESISSHAQSPSCVPASTAAASTSPPCSPVATVEDGATPRQQRVGMVTTPTAVTSGDKRVGCTGGGGGGGGGRVEADALACGGKVDVKETKGGEGGKRHGFGSDSLNSKGIADSARPAARKQKQSRGAGKEGKRRGQSSSTTPTNPVAATASSATTTTTPDAAPAGVSTAPATAE